MAAIADLPLATPERARIQAAWLMDESQCIGALLPQAELSPPLCQQVTERATGLVRRVRSSRAFHGGLDAFLHEYDLSSEEGVVLMCLAEALLRIPDPATADRLIRDKLSQGHWDRHLGHSHSLWVNASTWGLMLTGKLVRLESDEHAGALLRGLVKQGEPLIRAAVYQAMQIMGGQFILAPTIEQALECSSDEWRYSYDMLGEAAVTAKMADGYFQKYSHAIAVLGRNHQMDDVCAAPGISVKLSALHPRYEYAQRRRVLEEVAPKLQALARQAKSARIGLTLDAEEADRLELMLDLFERVFQSPGLKDWEGFGLALQAYQKRAGPVLDFLIELSRRVGKRIPLRLVKGAYWDTEIKGAQEQGLSGYPVFTRKVNTDVSYLALAKRILGHADAIFYPQFATHNAHTVAWIVENAGDVVYEFQRLHGMGEALYQALKAQGVKVPCRVYAPIGGYKDLLPYLVRRLLENGANTSFIHRLVDENLPVAQLVADPVEKVRGLKEIPHPRIPLPSDLYLPQRRNAQGVNLADPITLAELDQAMTKASRKPRQAAPVIGGEPKSGRFEPVLSPVDRQAVGQVSQADAENIEQAFVLAERAAEAWDQTPAHERAEMLERAAGLLQGHRAELMDLCLREAGKCLPDSVAEVREAVDYCYYYAAEVRRLFAEPIPLPGPSGEVNQMKLHGRGPFVCISPWNFPLAIFTGQIAAALAAGNPVLAKPAEQTPLVAALAVELLHKAGIPPDVLQLLPGGPEVGASLVSDNRVRGVAFTGSTETAWAIQQKLADRKAPIAALIAETGGLNAMIVDSSALPEQVVKDALTSAFNSAGQRCSALRVLFLQREIADCLLDMLAGALDELAMGHPGKLATDIGPVIDAAAQDRLQRHCRSMDREGRCLARLKVPDTLSSGFWFTPVIYEIDGLHQLSCEVFGPVLHIIRYDADELDSVIDAINATGYGLTLGIHSRVEETIRFIQNRARVGNIYVNRNMIGAVVGAQPFGGEGLSGTGPKAGGPHYLLRFATERTVTVNIAAVGGNPDLWSLHED